MSVSWHTWCIKGTAAATVVQNWRQESRKKCRKSLIYLNSERLEGTIMNLIFQCPCCIEQHLKSSCSNCLALNSSSSIHTTGYKISCSEGEVKVGQLFTFRISFPYWLKLTTQLRCNRGHRCLCFYIEYNLSFTF